MDDTPCAGSPLCLPAELTIYTVGELHPQWLAWLATAETANANATAATVQGDAVDQVDGAGLQLLLSLQRALAARGQRLALHAPSTALHSACQALGLGPWLQQHSTEVAA